MAEKKASKALEPAGKLSIQDPRIKKLTQEITKLQESTVRNFVLIGRKLLQTKKLLRHGDWLTWLEKEVRFSSRTAERFMKLASAPQLSGLGVNKALLLLSVPEKKRAALIEKPLPLPGGKKPIQKATTQEVRTYLRANEKKLGIKISGKPRRVTAVQLAGSFQKIRSQLERFDPEETGAFRKKQALVFDVLARVAELLWDDQKKIRRFKNFLGT